MKTDLSYLSERKRLEVEKIVELIRGAAEAEMIVLYGSYARGDWKEEQDLGEERRSGHARFALNSSSPEKVPLHEASA
jgi:uncharacterized protein